MTRLSPFSFSVFQSGETVKIRSANVEHLSRNRYANRDGRARGSYREAALTRELEDARHTHDLLEGRVEAARASSTKSSAES